MGKQALPPDPGRGLTAVQQLPHHGEVGVRHGVVQCRVAVAVGDVDHVVQQARRHGPEGDQMTPHQLRVGVTAARQAQPLLQHRGVGHFLHQRTRASGFGGIPHLHPQTRQEEAGRPSWAQADPAGPGQALGSPPPRHQRPQPLPRAAGVGSGQGRPLHTSSRSVRALALSRYFSRAKQAETRSGLSSILPRGTHGVELVLTQLTRPPFPTALLQRGGWWPA